MSDSSQKPSRRQQILHTLAQELENSPGQRITTASLAKAVGVSEAALYRHFPSKAKMFEGLIEFIEETIFGLYSKIITEIPTSKERCEKMLIVLLTFAEKNPGLTRILVGDALTGETERLRIRVVQFFDRTETQFKQVLREGNLANELQRELNINASANVMLAIAEGRMNQYVRSQFKQMPTSEWKGQWQLISKVIFN
jgi:TetR/AcrR family transcriptional regulator